jgi:hypothetical protein
MPLPSKTHFGALSYAATRTQSSCGANNRLAFSSQEQPRNYEANRGLRRCEFFRLRYCGPGTGLRSTPPSLCHQQSTGALAVFNRQLVYQLEHPLSSQSR